MKRLEQQQLDTIRSTLSDADKQAILQRTQALEERQAQEDDPGILPQVTLADVRPDVSYVAPSAHHADSLTTTEYVAGTNGLLYQQLIADLPALSHEQLTWLPFFTQAWTEVGAGGNDYLFQQQKQTATVGSLTSYASIKGAVDNCDVLQGYLVMTGKALAAKADDFSALMQETWSSADFSEADRLVDLLTQARSRREQGITGNGHGLAMSLAAAPLNAAAAIADDLGGLPQVKRLKERVLQTQRDGGDFLSQALQDIAAQISLPQEALLVHDEHGAAQHLQSLQRCWKGESATVSASLAWQQAGRSGWWMVDTQVNFCAWALPTVTMEHPDAPVLAVLAGVLRNAFLHTAIREKGGAYGAGATQDSSLGCFKFYSYRDPRVEGTFADFAASIDWVLSTARGDDLVEQSILGLIGSMDRPGSPAGEAKQFFHQDRSGRTRDIRQQFRQRLLNTQWADVQRVAEQYLKGQVGSRAVLAPRGTEALAEKLGLIANDY